MSTPIDLDYDDYELKTPAIITNSNQVRIADLEEEKLTQFREY